jgi:hypothetical protein
MKWYQEMQPTKKRGANKEKRMWYKIQRIKRHKKSKIANVEDDGVSALSCDGG